MRVYKGLLVAHRSMAIHRYSTEPAGRTSLPETRLSLSLNNGTNLEVIQKSIITGSNDRRSADMAL